MSYKSPIEIWCDDFVHNIAMQIRENNEMQIMAQINQHVSVDKEELIKALNYDRQQYEKLKASGIFAPLSEIFGTSVPDTAIDEYGIDFKSTGFAGYFDCFKEWNGDLVLCLRSGTLAESLINRVRGSKAYKRSYDLHKMIFADIVRFKVD